MTKERALPVTRLSRFVKLAGVGLRSGASLVTGFKNEEVAERAAEVLGTLRGLAAKVGQTLSYVDGIIPESHREAYERALGHLRSQAPVSNPTEIRNVVETELGGSVGELFRSWEPEPFASASIGQVHRAVLLDGRVVAVKVQHPGVADAIESDLKNAGVLKSIAGLAAPRGFNADEVFEVVRQRFREELDYAREADQQRFFIELHSGDPKIRIPEVIAERSSRRVLTSVFVEGNTLEQAALEPEELRRSYAESLWRFVFKGNLVGGRFNADPHPGNYIFQPDGVVTFLDFGCVQPLEPERRRAAVSMHRAAVERDDEGFKKFAREVLETQGGSYERVAVGYSRKCFDPLFLSPFRLTREYVASLVDATRELKREFWSKDKSFAPLPASLVFMNRLQFGFYSVLSRLDVTADYAAVERAFLPSSESG